MSPLVLRCQIGLLAAALLACNNSARRDPRLDPTIGAPGAPGATVGGEPAATSATAPSPAATSAPAVTSEGEPADPGPVVARPVATMPGFRMLDGGGSRVFVELTGRVRVVERTAPGVIALRLEGAIVPEKVNRLVLPTRHFQTPVDRVRLSQVEGGAELVIELRAPTPHEVSVRRAPGGSMVSVDFPRLVGEPAVAPREQPAAEGLEKSPVP